MAIISTKKRTKAQNKAAYKQTLPAIRAKARRRLAAEAKNPPKDKPVFSLDDLSPELKAKMGLTDVNTSEDDSAPTLDDADLPWVIYDPSTIQDL